MTKTSLHFQEFSMGGKIFHFWMADDSKFGFKIVISGIFHSQKTQNIARSIPVNQNSCQAARWSKIRNCAICAVCSSKFAELCTDPNNIFRI